MASKVQQLPAAAWRLVLRHKKKSLLAAVLSAVAVWKWEMVKMAGGFGLQLIQTLKLLSKMEEQQRRQAQRQALGQLQEQFGRNRQVADQLLLAVLQDLITRVDGTFAVDHLHAQTKELQQRKRQLVAAGQDLAEVDRQREELWQRFKIASLGRTVAVVYVAALVALMVHAQTSVVRRQAFNRSQQSQQDAGGAAMGSSLLPSGPPGGVPNSSPAASQFDQIDPELLQFLQQCTDGLALSLVQGITTGSRLESFCELISTATRRVVQDIELDRNFEFEEFWGLLRSISQQVAIDLRLRTDESPTASKGGPNFWNVISELFGGFHGQQQDERQRQMQEMGPNWSAYFFPSAAQTQQIFQTQYALALDAARTSQVGVAAAAGSLPQMQQPQQLDAASASSIPADPLVWEVAIRVGHGRDSWPARDGLRKLLLDRCLLPAEEREQLPPFRVELTPADLEELRRRQQGGAKPQLSSSTHAPSSSSSASAGVSATANASPATPPAPASARWFQFAQLLSQELARGQDLASEVTGILGVASAGELAADLVAEVLLPTLKPALRQSFEALAARQQSRGVGEDSLPLVLCLMAQIGAYGKALGSAPGLVRAVNSTEALEQFCKVIFFPVSSPPVFEDPNPPEAEFGGGGGDLDQALQQLLQSMGGGGLGGLEGLGGMDGMGGMDDLAGLFGGAGSGGNDLASLMRQLGGADPMMAGMAGGAAGGGGSSGGPAAGGNDMLMQWLQPGPGSPAASGSRVALVQ